jgi:hypothetical protein
MKHLSIPLRVIFTLLVIAMLAACAPGEATLSPEEIAAQVATSVAMTVEAQDQIATFVAMTVAAQEAEAAEPLPTPAFVTATPLPTLTPVLVTATVPVLDTPDGGGNGGGTSGGGTSGGGGGYTQYDYSCDIILQQPRDNTDFRRTHTFDVAFTILNNGTKTWDAGLDLVLLGNPGSTITNPPGIIQIPNKMKPGDTFPVGPFDAQAPDEPGHYVIDFKLEGGWCYPYVAFNVVR